jgi:GDPmannose 4,6-dehydratase
MARTALITGVRGQDGGLLAESLLADGYRVVGLARPGSGPPARADREALTLIEVDLLDAAAVEALLARHAPDEIYHLAAFHHSSQQQDVLSALETKESMIGMNFFSTLNLALGVARGRIAARMVFASSSQIYSTGEGVRRCDELTPRNPRTLYGHCKSWSMDLLRFLRAESGLHFCSAILFNHESPRRASQFVTRKISLAAAHAKAGKPVDLRLINIGARVDWSSARDVVQALRLIAGASRPDDFVVASGILHSVRDVLEIAFGHVGLDWRGYASFTEERKEPALVGDPSRIRAELGWRQTIDFPSTIIEMVDHDLQSART